MRNFKNELLAKKIQEKKKDILEKQYIGNADLDSHPSNVVFSRMNNSIPFRFIKDAELKELVEMFMLDTLGEILEINPGKIQLLKQNRVLRDIYFEQQRVLYDFIVSNFMKNPKLARKAVNYVFSKQE